MGAPSKAYWCLLVKVQLGQGLATSPIREQKLLEQKLRSLLRFCTFRDGQDIMHWQSDFSIVSMKSMKVDGEKGVAVMQRDIRDTSARLRAGGQMTTKLMSLTLRARENPKERFTSLAYLLNEDFLKRCFWELKRDKASGCDGELTYTLSSYRGSIA